MTVCWTVCFMHEVYSKDCAIYIASGVAEGQTPPAEFLDHEGPSLILAVGRTTKVLSGFCMFYSLG